MTAVSQERVFRRMRIKAVESATYRCGVCGRLTGYGDTSVPGAVLRFEGEGFAVGATVCLDCLRHAVDCAAPKRRVA